MLETKKIKNELEINEKQLNNRFDKIDKQMKQLNIKLDTKVTGVQEDINSVKEDIS